MPAPYRFDISDEEKGRSNNRFVMITENNQSSNLQEPASSGSFLSGFTSYAACAIGLAVSNSLAIDRIVPSLIGRGICLNNLIPTSVLKSYLSWTRATAMIPSQIHKFIYGKGPGNSFFETGVLAPVCEEVEYRYLIQHVLLKKVPQAILEKVAPNYAEMINKWPVQVLRAFIVAVLFAAAHSQSLSCDTWGGMPQLIGGFLYGLLNEYHDGNIVHTINLHMIHNMFVMLFG